MPSADGKDTTLLARYERIRAFTEALSEGLSAEDCLVQAMPDASPTKWHLAHTTWFFETFVLAHAVASYAPYDERYGYLWNSYYEAVGARHPRPARGLLTRPTLAEVRRYRQVVDERMRTLLAQEISGEVARRVELGLQHEQQHQELVLTDLQAAFFANPLRPAYRPLPPGGANAAEGRGESRAAGSSEAATLAFVDGPEGLVDIGHAGGGFSFDNERPRHRAYLAPHALGSRLVTCGEWMDFTADGGYEQPALWLSDGWATVQREGWTSPLHWERRDGVWWRFSPHGMRAVDASEPVCHVSYYEADAYARWAGARLPTECEWEAAAARVPGHGNFVESGLLRPSPADASTGMALPHAPSQLIGDVWEWTSSAYASYPGFQTESGALGEYNGKFMCNQFVLRGGSCFTPQSHVRATYRNFFPPHARWQMTGVRLARGRG